MSGSNIIVIEKELLRSEAFRSLFGIAKDIYFDFRMKCRVKKIKAKPGRKAELFILNNGEITYSYAEALNRGITRPRFKRALKELVEHGFIDIAHSGSGGIKGDVSLYSISERWRSYGTDNFINRTMRKDTRGGRGFAVYWERKKSNIGNARVTQDSNAGVTS
jgi:hypothetical protein